MGSCLTKPPVNVSVNNTSSCPSPCCDGDTCSIFCCVMIKRDPSSPPLKTRSALISQLNIIPTDPIPVSNVSAMSIQANLVEREKTISKTEA